MFSFLLSFWEEINFKIMLIGRSPLPNKALTMATCITKMWMM